MIAQIQRKGEFVADDGGFDAHGPGRVADPEKSRAAPAFGFEGIDWERFVTTAARMDHMILETACRSLHPGVDYIECQRRMNTNAGMQGEIGRASCRERV